MQTFNLYVYFFLQTIKAKLQCVSMSDIYSHNVQITNNTTIQSQAKMVEIITCYITIITLCCLVSLIC